MNANGRIQYFGNPITCFFGRLFSEHLELSQG